MIPFFKKKIYLTRAIEDNLNFQKYFNLLQPNLEAKEIFISVPLLNICFDNIENLFIPENNLIFTSRHGIKAFSESRYLNLKKIFCVGKSTAEIAIQFGFKNVCFPDEGNVKSLIKLISKEKKNLQTFHYLRGEKVSFNLRKALSDLGYKTNETVIYRQESNNLSYEHKKTLLKYVFF